MADRRIINAIVVDDEELGREAVCVALKSVASDFRIVAECASGEEAICQIKTLEPDVVFLDIQMPRCDGFDVVAELGDRMPLVVFVTAYDRYALQAFEVFAIDYVLKPLDPDRWSQTIHRIRRLVQHGLGEEPMLGEFMGELSGTKPRKDRIVVRSGTNVVILDPAEVLYVKAAGNYLKLYAQGDNVPHLIRETINKMEQRLGVYRYFRLHRSYIVNLDHVRELRCSDNSRDREVIMSNGSSIPVGRSYLRELSERLGKS